MRPESDLAITHTYNMYLPRPHPRLSPLPCAKKRSRRNCKNNETTKTVLVVNALIDTLLPSQWLSCNSMRRGGGEERGAEEAETGTAGAAAAATPAEI